MLEVSLFYAEYQICLYMMQILAPYIPQSWGTLSSSAPPELGARGRFGICIVQ